MKKALALLLCLLLLPLTAPAEEGVTLRVNDWIDEDVLAAFTAETGVRVELAENLAGTLQDSIVSGENIDIYTVYSSGAYRDILEKGYASPIESDALLEKSRALLPALREILFQGEALMAYPSQLELKAWTLDETGWQAAGFTLEQIPETLADFLACFARWQEEGSAECPDRYFFEGGSLEYLVEVIVRQYIVENESPAAAVDFDDPAFRAALEQLSAARPLFAQDAERMEAVQNGELEAFPLIYNYTMSYGYTSLDSNRARPMPIPALTAGEAPFVEAEARLYFISARSQHPKEAAAFIAFLAEHPGSIQTEYELYSADSVSPLENASFPALLEKNTRELARLKQELPTCKPEEKQQKEERIAWLEGWMGRQDEIRWIISPEDIALRRALTRRVAVPGKSLYLAGGANCAETLSTLISRFAAGELSPDQLISEMNRTCALAFKEQ